MLKWLKKVCAGLGWQFKVYADPVPQVRKPIPNIEKEPFSKGMARAILELLREGSLSTSETSQVLMILRYAVPGNYGLPTYIPSTQASAGRSQRLMEISMTDFTKVTDAKFNAIVEEFWQLVELSTTTAEKPELVSQK